MVLNTKYNIGDMVLFCRNQETTGGSKIHHKNEVGIIEKIVITEHGNIQYYLVSSYSGPLLETEIISLLVEIDNEQR